MDADFSGLLSRVQTLPDAPETCPAVKPGERCRNGWHELVSGVSPCPMERYRSERKRMRNKLELCKYGPERDEMAEPVAEALYKAIDPDRDADTLGKEGVENLRATKARLAVLRREYRTGARHIAIFGGTGTAKTMMSFHLYFAWLYRGMSCHWIEQEELIRQAKNMHSGIEGLPESAESWRESVKRYKILFLSDLASQKADKSLGAGESPLANLLLSLLNDFAGRIVWDCNLDADTLRQHPDIGPRIVSRLMADHGGAPCEILKLSGADQRQHLLRSEKRNA